MTADLALQAAQLADVRIAKGEAGLLTGIPMAHKDIFVRKMSKQRAVQKCSITLLHLTTQRLWTN